SPNCPNSGVGQHRHQSVRWWRDLGRKPRCRFQQQRIEHVGLHHRFHRKARSRQHSNGHSGRTACCNSGALIFPQNRCPIARGLITLTLTLIMNSTLLSQSEDSKVEGSKPGLVEPNAITDSKKVTAKPDANVEQGEESLSLQRLYMTRQVGGTAWSPDGKSIVF